MSFTGRVQFPGHVNLVMAATAALTPSAVATGGYGTQTITVPGALVGDEASVVCNASLGAIIINAEVNAANTVTIKFANTSGGSVTPPSANYTALVWRLDPAMFT